MESSTGEAVSPVAPGNGFTHHTINDGDGISSNSTNPAVHAEPPIDPMMFEHTNMYANRVAEGYGLHLFERGQSSQPPEEHLDRRIGSAPSSQSLAQFSGLQAIADAAMVNATDSLFDPALFETRRSPALMYARTNEEPMSSEEPAVEALTEKVEHDAPIDTPCDYDPQAEASQPEASQPEAVSVEEMLTQDVDAFPRSLENSHSSSAETNGALAPVIAAELELSERKVLGQHVPTLDASKPHVLEEGASCAQAPQPHGLQTDLPAPQTPERDLIEEHSVDTMEVDVLTQHSPATSDLSEPPTSPAITTAVFDEPIRPLQAVVTDVVTVNEEPAVAEDQRVAEEQVVPKESALAEGDIISPGLRRSMSRASSVLSDAPTDVVTNEVESKAQAETTTTKKKKKLRSSEYPQAPANDVESIHEKRQAKRHSSRQSKPIERLSTQQHAEVEAWSTKKVKKPAPNPLVNGHGPAKSSSPEIGRSRPNPAKTPVTTPIKASTKSVGRKRSVKPEMKQEVAVLEQNSSPVTETEEEMNRRIALQIHQEGLGLRRRSRGS
jgi:hypothetical protein